MTVLEARNLSYAVEGEPLVSDASFSLSPGTLTMLIGPNGAGKSTLIRLALGLLEPHSGQAFLSGERAFALSPRKRALRAAYLPQSRQLAWPQPVGDVVALGRFAYGAAPGRLSSADASAVERAMAACRLEGFEDRAVDTLSGGEMARVHIARALAAETRLLVADEPAAALDPRYQHEVMQLFAAAAADDRAVLTVVHDLSLAVRYADRLIWMRDGRIVADGPPAETMTAERLRSVFGVVGRVRHDGAALSVEIEGPA